MSGLVYIFANYLGTIVEGAPMYPYADWKNVPLTIFLYFFLACLQTYAYMKICAYINKKNKRINESRQAQLHASDG